ncbi:MAG: hypothetical protein KDD11_19495 [Acidobacteria bacterium]|nr:hypothetical protein [Acidobacteriota bacterium]
MELLTALILGLVALGMVGVGIAWIGFQTLAPPFKPPAGTPRELERRPLPEGLPAPVERWLRQVCGDGDLPVVHTAVGWGRGRLRLGVVWAPTRFRTHQRPGERFERTLDVSWFGRPIVRTHERYAAGRGSVDAHGRIERQRRGPRVDRAQHLALWAETLWAPATLALDPRLSWRAVDERSAELDVPWDGGTETLVFTFDPRNGWLRRIEASRPRGDDADLHRWRVDLRSWQELDGHQVPTVAVVRWLDQLAPYAILHLHGVAYDLEEPVAEVDDEEEDDFD